MKDIKEIIAENLIYLRKKNKYTQLELAEKLNYSDKSISKWEHAETVPDIEVLKKIADLYSVTLDYFVTDLPKEEKEKFLKKKVQNSQNKIIITLLAISFVWILATVIFVYSHIINSSDLWIIYVWAIPVSFLIALYFNQIWGKRIYRFAILSCFIWTLLLTFYLQFLSYNIWLVFLVGIPIQIAIILWSQIKVSN